MSETSPTSIRFNEEEEQLLEELKEEMQARSRSDAVRRSVAQSSFLQKHAVDGCITIVQADGTLLKLPVTLR